MTNARRVEPEFQRNVLAPGLLAALVCLAAAFLTAWPQYVVLLYAISILALICAWFAAQARQWWALPILLAIAVLWNPIYPFGFSGTWWMALHILAGAAFIACGLLIKSPRA